MRQQSYGRPFGAHGDVIGCYYDIVGGTVSFSVNGVWVRLRCCFTAGASRPVWSCSSLRTLLSLSHFAQVTCDVAVSRDVL